MDRFIDKYIDKINKKIIGLLLDTYKGKIDR